MISKAIYMFFFYQIISYFSMNSKNVLFNLIFCPNLSYLAYLSFFLSFLSLKHVSSLEKNTKRTEHGLFSERTI